MTTCKHYDHWPFFVLGIFIGLVAGFTIPVWIAWVLLGYLNDSEWEDPAMAFGLLIVATLILFIMYLPKVSQHH